MGRSRADVVLTARGLYESRAKAKEAIEAGLVCIGGRVIAKASELVDEEAEIDAGRPYDWVSRGGVKLAAALDAFGIDPAGATCLDVGASTGGFTDVLLSRSAARVYAVDVGHGQLHPRVAADPRVRSLEGLDARSLEAAIISTPPDLIVCDVSFISLTLALPRPLSLAAPNARLVALIKPQFEAGPAHVKKGLVKSEEARQAARQRIALFLEEAGWTILGVIPSPILGGDGNQEFLIAAERRAGGC